MYQQPGFGARPIPGQPMPGKAPVGAGVNAQMMPGAPAMGGQQYQQPGFQSAMPQMPMGGLMGLGGMGQMNPMSGSNGLPGPGQTNIGGGTWGGVNQFNPMQGGAQGQDANGMMAAGMPGQIPSLANQLSGAFGGTPKAWSANMNQFYSPMQNPARTAKTAKRIIQRATPGGKGGPARGKGKGGNKEPLGQITGYSDGGQPIYGDPARKVRPGT